MTKENKPTIIDRMNYTNGIETRDLMTEQERADFEKMNTTQRTKFLQEVIFPRATHNQQ